MSVNGAPGCNVAFKLYISQNPINSFAWAVSPAK